MTEARSAKFPDAARASPAERAIALVACWPIAAPSLLLLANTVIPSIDLLPIHLGTLAVYGLFAIALAGSLRLALGRLTPMVALVALILILAFVVVMIFDQENGDYYLSIATASLSLAVPWLLVANAVQEIRQFLRYLYIAAIVILIAGAVRLYLPDPLGLTTSSYSQYAGYQMLPAVLIFIDDFLNRRRFRSGAFAAAALVLMLGAGARGPLLAFVLYLIARAVVALRRRPVAAVVLTATALAAALWLNVVAPSVLAAMTRLFTAQGLSTRAIDRLIAGNFLEDRIRETLVGHTWDLILRYPVTGVGLSRDRLFLAARMGERDPEMIHGWYPHNIFLELLVQWGIFVGGFLIIVMALTILRGILHDGEGPARRVIMIFIGIGLWPLMISGSYLTSPHFFALLGFCLASRKLIIPAKQRSPTAAKVS